MTRAKHRLYKQEDWNNLACFRWGGVPPRVRVESQSNPSPVRVGPPTSDSSRIRVGFDTGSNPTPPLTPPPQSNLGG